MPDVDFPVLPHGPIQPLADNLWHVEGSVSRGGLKRVMTLARLDDGRIVVHNAIALDAESMARVDAWGRVAFIVVPSRFHRIDGPRFAARYPGAKVICPAGARAHVAKVTRVDGTYDDVGDLGSVHFHHLDGLKQREGVMAVSSPDGETVVFNDVVFNAPHMPGFAGWMMRHVTNSTGGPRISRIARLALVSDGKAFGAHLRRIAERDVRRAVVAHHEILAEPAATLRALADSVG